MININKARQILKEDGIEYSDKEIRQLLEHLYIFAGNFLSSYEKNYPQKK